MKRLLTFSQCCEDKNIFGSWFSGPSWSAWRVLDRAIFGEPLSPTQLETFTQLTGRTVAPTSPCREFWCATGRRTAKSAKAAAIVCYLSTIGVERFGWRKRLSPGERGVCALLAVDRDQAQTLMSYCKAYFERPLLAKMVSRITADTIELTNKITIDVMTADTRRIRGRTMISATLDEVGHLRSDTAINADEAIYEAMTPSLATMDGGMVLGISSPHMRRGLLFRKVSDHWAKNDDPVLVARGATWALNPMLPRDSEVIQAAYKRNPGWADAEYGANWRVDIEGYCSLEAVLACTDTGVYERRPDRQHRFHAAYDGSGGVGDSAALAIGHREGDTIVVDLIRENHAPHDPEAVCAEYADILRAWRIKRVVSDRYGAEWVKSCWRRNGIAAIESDYSASEAYCSFLPMLNSQQVRLLDSERLRSQLMSLERSPRRASRDQISHPRDLHDDVSNVCALLCTHIDGKRYAGGDAQELRPTLIERSGRIFDARGPWI